LGVVCRYKDIDRLDPYARFAAAARRNIVKINAPTTRPTLGTDSAPQRSSLAQAYGGAVSSSTGGSSQVALSDTSRALSDLQDGKSDIDTARVAEIKAAIASGQLKIDAGKIADGIIASARELVK